MIALEQVRQYLETLGLKQAVVESRVPGSGVRVRRLAKR